MDDHAPETVVKPAVDACVALHDDRVKDDPQTPVPEQAPACGVALSVLRKTTDAHRNGCRQEQEPLLVADILPGDTVTVETVAGKRFPLPSQADGWSIPEAMRRHALAKLWSIIRSGSANQVTQIRAIEALVRLDGQALNTERQADWRDIQAGKATRSNVRALADLVNRNRDAKQAKP